MNVAFQPTPLVTLLDGAASPEEVEHWVDQAFAKGAEVWPRVSLSREELVAHLAVSLRRDVPLSALHATDLYLVAACLGGKPEALSSFEEAFGPKLLAVVRRVSRTVDAEEVVQGLREALLVGKLDVPARLREYSGSGELGSWLRVVATRAALNAATRGPRERPADDDGPLVDAAASVESVEVTYFRLHYGAEVRAQLPNALASLSSHDRLLLRQHHLDHVTLDAMARMHGVHVATVKRQLADARDRLKEALARLLRERLGLSPSELQSVLAAVESQFHVTMQRLLPAEGTGRDIVPD